jgi:hypothetical protein
LNYPADPRFVPHSHFIEKCAVTCPPARAWDRSVALNANAFADCNLHNVVIAGLARMAGAVERAFQRGHATCFDRRAMRSVRRREPIRRGSSEARIRRGSSSEPGARFVKSTEVRWFFEGAAPPPLVERLSRRGGPIAPLDERGTDRFLVLAGCCTVGVQIRGVESGGRARLELAAAGTARGASLSFGPAAEGRVESWLKCSASGAAIERFAASLPHRPAGWLDVSRRRRLRQFAAVGSTVVEIEPRARPRAGCRVDLTELLAPSAWWSFGLEAFGPEDTQRATLRAAATAFFAQYAAPWPLSHERSWTWPRWLHHVTSAAP